MPMINRDDLLVVEGIDPVIEMALNSMGIWRFSDLANRIPANLATLLEERTGVSIAITTIENWIEYAAKHKVPANKLVVQDNLEEQTMTIGNNQTEKTDIEKPGAPGQLNNNVTEAGKTYNQLGERIKPKKKDKNKSKTVFFSINRVCVSRLPSTVPGTLKMRAEVSCQFQRSQVQGLLADEVPFCSQIHAINNADGKCDLLASRTVPLHPDQYDYDIPLEFTVMAVGIYQLHVVAFLLTGPAEIDLYPGPVLNVIDS